MSEYQRSPLGKRVAFALEHNTSSRPESPTGSITETTSTVNQERFTFESRTQSQRESPERRKKNRNGSPEVSRGKHRKYHGSPPKRVRSRLSEGQSPGQSTEKRSRSRHPKSLRSRRDRSHLSIRAASRRLKDSRSLRKHRSRQRNEKSATISKKSDLASQRAVKNAPCAGTVLKSFKKASATKKFGVVPIIRESSADAELKHEVAEFLNTLPTLSTGPASERRIYSEQTEPDRTLCANLKSLLTFFEHKIHDIRYPAEFKDFDLKKLWYNPMFKTDFKLKPRNLVMQRKIGSGSFGVVYCAVDQEAKKKYAIKCIRKKTGNQDRGLRQQEKEFYVWRQTSGHPNIVPLYAAFETVRAYCFVMDYVKSGSLNRVLRKNTLSEEVIRKIAAQLAHALHTVHALGCLHRDISCSNILITPSFDVQLSDFGISLVGLSTKTRCGSLAYMAPEVIACRTSGPGADWWSYGIVLFTLFEGMTPLSLYVKRWNIDLNRLSKQNRYEVARNATVPINPLLEKGKRILLKELFRDEPAQRLGVRDKMSFQPFKDHEYFQGFNWTELDTALYRILKKRSRVPFV